MLSSLTSSSSTSGSLSSSASSSASVRLVDCRETNSFVQSNMRTPGATNNNHGITKNLPPYLANIHTTPSSANSTPPSSSSPSSQTTGSIPVWRSVGEKSALRGYLTLLGVTPEASLADIRGAYKKLALQWHPDRSDAPNARMKFQEISQAYMALCVEEGDAQDVDTGLYEKEAQASCEEVSYLGGMAGVTSGLAGVFCGMGMGTYAPYLGLNYKSPTQTSNGASLVDPLDLYHRNGMTTTSTSSPLSTSLKSRLSPKTHALTCTCHATNSTTTPGALNNHVHTPSCQHQQQQQQQLHSSHSHTSGSLSPLGPSALSLSGPKVLARPITTTMTTTTGTGIGSSHDDIASAIQADLSLLTGVLQPPVIAVGDNSVQVRISPLAGPNAPTQPMLYQIELKIKKSYQLVYQGTSLTYAVPNLVPGTKYMFRVRALPLPAGYEDDNFDAITVAAENGGVHDPLNDGTGGWSQPTTVTTQGTKPDGNQPHPPVLSNLQIALLNKKHAGKKKKGGNKTTITTVTTPTTSAISLAKDDSQTSTPPPEPSSNVSTPSKSSRSLASSRTPSPVVTPLKETPTTNATATVIATAMASVTVPSTPSTNASSVVSSTPSTLSKKEAKLRAKQQEEAQRRLEAEREAQRRIEEEVAYQKFLLAAREEAERQRLEEEQRELERYAKLKEEQDLKRAAEEKAAAAAAKTNKNATTAAAASSKTKKSNSTSAASVHTSTVTSVTPTPVTSTKDARSKKTSPMNGSPNKAAVAAAAAAVAAAPIMHIKLTPEQQAALKQTQIGALTATPAPIASAKEPNKTAPPVTTAPATSASGKVKLPPATSSPLAPPKQSAWSSPVTTAAVVAKALPVSNSTHGSGAPNTPALAPVPASSSPIIRSKPVGGKAWVIEPTPIVATPTMTTQSTPPTSASTNMPLLSMSQHLAASAHSTPSLATLQSDSLSEHLGRFDASKPWQADAITQQRMVRDQQAQQQQQQQHLHPSHLTSHHHQFASPSSASVYDPSVVPRFSSLSPYGSSHSLLSSTAFSSILNSSPSSSSSWHEDDLLFSDLHHELERARWNSHPSLASSSSSAAAVSGSIALSIGPSGLASPTLLSPSRTTTTAIEAAWNNTANTTLASLQPPSVTVGNASTNHTHNGGGNSSNGTSARGSGALQFTPLSSLLSDYADTSLPTPNPNTASTTSSTTSRRTSASHQDGIYMPSMSRNTSSTNLAGSPVASPTSSLTGIGSSFGSSSFPSFSSSLSAFPTTSLSIDAPSFNPMMGSATLAASPSPLVVAADNTSNGTAVGSTSNGAIGAHTRLPLSAHSAGGSNPSSTSLPSLYGGFALPSFSSFASFGVGSSSSPVGVADWSAAPSSNVGVSGALNGSSVVSSVSALHDALVDDGHHHHHHDDDDDDDLFNSIPPMPTDQDEVLIPAATSHMRNW